MRARLYVLLVSKNRQSGGTIFFLLESVEVTRGEERGKTNNTRQARSQERREMFCRGV